MDINRNVVYRIFSDRQDITQCYIGSTKNLKLRKASHLHLYKFSNNKLYEYMRLYGIDNFKFEVLASIGKYEKHTLIGLERLYYNLYLPELNCNIPFQTPREWQLKNKHKLNINMTKYRLNNRKKINDIATENYNNNKEWIKKKNLEYYHKNKEKIKNKNNFNCNCACGSQFLYKNKKLHLNSSEHKKDLLINITKSKNLII